MDSNFFPQISRLDSEFQINEFDNLLNALEPEEDSALNTSMQNSPEGQNSNREGDSGPNVNASLNMNMTQNNENNSEINTEISTKTDASNKILDRKRQERKLTIEIEKWLKERFRKAFEALKVTFEEADRQIHHDQVTGTLTRSSFRACLGKYGLQLSNDEQLENFLARCGLLVGFCEESFL